MSSGSCALISGGETMNSGIVEPFSVTQEPARVFGRGLPLLEAPIGARFVPWTEINPPPVRGCEESAVFTTFEITGGAVAASKFDGSTVKPDCVSRTIAFPPGSGATVRVNGLTFGSGAGGGGGAPATCVGGTTIGKGTTV